MTRFQHIRIIAAGAAMLLCLPGGCDGKKASGDDPATAKLVGEGPVEKPDGPKKLSREEMLPAHKLKKGEILVGGCRESCEDPKNAFRNFVRALLIESPPGLPAVKTFFDTTTLVDNDEELGQQWADMWLMNRADERAASIARWLEGYLRRVGRAQSLTDVNDSLASGLVFRRISSRVVEFEFVPPNRRGATNSESWRFRLGLRGLEWLVQAVYD
jgi:hypothetical protein